MDPITIIMTVGSLVGAALKGIGTVNDYHDRYSRAAITIASMRAQCSCVDFALLQVQDIVLHNLSSASRLRSDTPLLNHFMTVFGACQVVFSILVQRLNKLVDETPGIYGQIAKTARIKQMWNDQEMKDLLRNIESQASAMSLLLSALQMRTNAEMYELLAKRESKKIFDKVSDDASSLRTAEDARMRDSKVEGVDLSLHSSFDEVEFDFDFEIINTTTYRNAFRKVSRHNLMQPQVGLIEDPRKPHLASQNMTPLSNVVEDWNDSGLGLEEIFGSYQNIKADTEDLLDLSGPSFDNPPRVDIQVQTNAKTDQIESLTGPSRRPPSPPVQSGLIDITTDHGASAHDFDFSISPGFYNDLIEMNPEFPSHNSTPITVSNYSMESSLQKDIPVECDLTTFFRQRHFAATTLNLNKVKNANSISSFAIPDAKFGIADQSALAVPPKSIINTYTIQEIVHDGTSSKVLIGRRGGTAELLAIKVVNRPNLPSSQSPDPLKRIHLEVAILHDLSHYNIIKLHELIELENQIVIIMAHVSSLTLREHILLQRKGNELRFFPEVTVWSIFRQLISGVKYWHENQTIHHNLTLDNLLFDQKTERIVIKGFNLAEVVSKNEINPEDQAKLGQNISPSTTKYENPYYTAPELLAYGTDELKPFLDARAIHIKGKVDVYSCGVILFALFSGVLPYNENMIMTQFSQWHAIEHCKIIRATPLDKMFAMGFRGDFFAEEFVRNLVEIRSEARYDISQVELHPWLQECPRESKWLPFVTIREDNWAPELAAQLEETLHIQQ